MTGWISEELRRLEDAGLRRTPPVLSGAQDPEVVVDGRQFVLLCSNNYLGLAADPRVTRAAADAALEWGAGAGASRLVSGTTELHRRLERELADLKGTEDCVLFSSGYLANVGTVAALVGDGDEVFSDALNHASIIDGCRLSGAAKSVFEHADAEDLERRIASSRAPRKLVVTDSVFSMDGDLAPVADLVEVCSRYGATLMVDEAHATGVLGDGGRGAAHGLGADVVMGTLSKALGSTGGYVCGSATLVEWLRNRARTHVFDTALPASAVGAALEAMRIMRTEPWRGQRARALSTALADGIRDAGFDVAVPAAAVVAVIVGPSRRAVQVSEALSDAGVLCPAIRPPTVPDGTARLRVTAMATHTDEHRDRAIDAFRASAGARAAPRPRPPARGLFVTGTDTGVGKTVVTAMVARALGMLGRRVGVLKPAQTGGGDDAGFAARVGRAARSESPVVLREPLAPAVAARLEGVTIDIDALAAVYDDLARDCDVVLVEGAGGWMVPLTGELTMGDLAVRLGLETLVVARPGLGTINHSALTVRAARRVAGVVLSGFPAEPAIAEATNPAEIERACGVPLTGVVPFVDGLDVDAGRCPEALDPRPWLAPSLGGWFDRRAFLLSLEQRRTDVARA